MENSILTSTKKILGLTEDYTAFDLDILTHINSTLSILYQIGIGDTAISIEDSDYGWSDLGLPQAQLSMVRTYVFLKVRLLFDPPQTSFLLQAMNDQVQEHEVRLNDLKELEWT